MSSPCTLLIVDPLHGQVHPLTPSNLQSCSSNLLTLISVGHPFLLITPGKTTYAEIVIFFPLNG